MPTNDPWAAFNPQAAPAPSTFNGRPVIVKGPAPQTSAQAEGDVLDNAVKRGKVAQTSNDIAKANADAVKAQRDLQDAAEEKAQKQQSAMETTRDLVQSLNRARGLVSAWSTGFLGHIGQKLPWGDQANQLETVINQEVRGNIFKNWVADMKAESSTGGTGIGRVMQSEIPLVTGSLGALDPVAMGEQGTLHSIDQITHRVIRMAAMRNHENPDDPKVIKKYHDQFLSEDQTPADATTKSPASKGWGTVQVVGH